MLPWHSFQQMLQKPITNVIFQAFWLKLLSRNKNNLETLMQWHTVDSCLACSGLMKNGVCQLFLKFAYWVTAFWIRWPDCLPNNACHRLACSGPPGLFFGPLTLDFVVLSTILCMCGDFVIISRARCDLGSYGDYWFFHFLLSLFVDLKYMDPLMDFWALNTVELIRITVILRVTLFI